MFISTIIPTVGRPALARAVCSVLEQAFDHADFEVIVVNDSGRPLPPADWQQSGRVRLLDTNCWERSVARNTGAAVARGEYFHFLDDDDWLLPGAFESLWQLVGRGDRRAAWFYGGFRLVDGDDNRIADVYPQEEGNCAAQLLAWEWIPLQTSLIRARAFFEAGGFEPLNSLLEDLDLGRRIVLAHDFAGTADILGCVRIGDQGSTTRYETTFEQNRRSREKMLGAAGIFGRLQASAGAGGADRAYWRGRIVYCYLAAAQWNLRRGKLSAMVSRGAYAVAGMAAAGADVLSAGFWRGLTKPHLNRVGAALEQAGASLFSGTNWQG